VAGVNQKAGLNFLPFYPSAWLGDWKVNQMSLMEQGGYFRLLCYAWESEQKSLPMDDKQLAMMLGITEKQFARHKEKIMAPFHQKDGRWHQKRMEAELESIQWYRKKYSEAGKKGMEKRWGKHNTLITSDNTLITLDNTLITNREEKRREEEEEHDRPNESSHSSTLQTKQSLFKEKQAPLAKRKKYSRRPENFEEMRLFALEKGMTEKDAKWFWLHCEGNGWTNGGKPIVSWKHTMSAWREGGYLPSTQALKHTPKK
jgi:uncharacterized protein YdaU (DUF1376 family)